MQGLAAKLIREDWTGTRIVELEGPSRLTPNDLADSFARVIGKPVRAVPVPRESWEDLFRSQRMRNPEPHMRMLDGLNEGWIEFEDGGSKAIKGSTNAIDILAALVDNTPA
jgi:NAD(P)H dehydrogenase (quinone)